MLCLVRGDGCVGEAGVDGSSEVVGASEGGLGSLSGLDVLDVVGAGAEVGGVNHWVMLVAAVASTVPWML